MKQKLIESLKETIVDILVLAVVIGTVALLCCLLAYGLTHFTIPTLIIGLVLVFLGSWFDHYNRGY